LERRPDSLGLGLEPPLGNEIVEGLGESVRDAYRDLLRHAHRISFCTTEGYQGPAGSRR
jgi:hypothetical protein